MPKADPWPGFVSPQLALLVDSPPTSEEWVHEIKFDGYRLQVHLKNSKIKLFTRGSLDWSGRFPNLIQAFEKMELQSAIFDGEVVVMDKSGRSHFGDLQKALAQKDYSQMRIYLFDLLYLNGEDLRKRPLRERKTLLKSILPKSDSILFYSEDVKGNGSRFFEISCQYKLEGIVSKNREAPYTSGRSHSWCKTKCTHWQEFVIGGYTAGKGERQNAFGALLLGVYEKVKGIKKFRYVGRVGTGFDDKTLSELKKKMLKLKQKKSPFELNSPKGDDLYWIKPILVCEVHFSEWTTDQILRSPVYMGLRNDKLAEDIVMEQAVPLSPFSPGNDVVLTHPKRVLFPLEKITKQMIADYYQIVSGFMLPHIADRPLSLFRCPKGGAGKCFYQKHPEFGNGSKNFHSFKVVENNEINLYHSLDSALGLKELVQMNAYEIHTWNAHHQSLMSPDQIVMDFDPDPAVSFKNVVQAALELKKILDSLKLKSFVKVTGGKGLHIHIPIAPLYSWEQVKSFSRALVDEMISRNPEAFTSSMSKEKRKGKIFIDYLRNTYGATAIAPYSLRAKEISAVALPVEWSELSKLKSSSQFTMKKALLKIKRRKSDPWKSFYQLKQKIKLLE